MVQLYFAWKGHFKSATLNTLSGGAFTRAERTHGSNMLVFLLCIRGVLDVNEVSMALFWRPECAESPRLKGLGAGALCEVQACGRWEGPGRWHEGAAAVPYASRQHTQEHNRALYQHKSLARTWRKLSSSPSVHMLLRYGTMVWTGFVLGKYWTTHAGGHAQTHIHEHELCAVQFRERHRHGISVVQILI